MLLQGSNCKVFRPGSDWEMGPWKLETEMKIGFLSIKNRIFCLQESVARIVQSNPLTI